MGRGLEAGRNEYSRRFIIGASLAAEAISACTPGDTQVNKKSPDVSIEIPAWQRNPLDVFASGNGYVLVRNGKAFPLSSSDFNFYRQVTKFDEYGRKVRQDVPQEVRDMSRATVGEERVLIDVFSQWEKANKKRGGEVADYWSGMLSDDREFREVTSLDKRQFSFTRGKLEKSGEWSIFDSFFFTYGRRDLADSYVQKDTLRDLRENVKNAGSYVATEIDNSPLCQRNAVGHSLGGLLMLCAAMEHPEAFNNLVFLSSPLYGLDESKFGIGMVAAGRTLLQVKTGVEEQLSKYLFGLWKHTDYRKQVDEFLDWFVSTGRRVIVRVGEGDPLCPQESTPLEHRTKTLKGKEIGAVIKPKKQMANTYDVFTAVDIHGLPLIDEETAVIVGDAFGKNLVKIGS